MRSFSVRARGSQHCGLIEITGRTASSRKDEYLTGKNPFPTGFIPRRRPNFSISRVVPAPWPQPARTFGGVEDDQGRSWLAAATAGPAGDRHRAGPARAPTPILAGACRAGAAPDRAGDSALRSGGRGHRGERPGAGADQGGVGPGPGAGTVGAEPTADRGRLGTGRQGAVVDGGRGGPPPETDR